MKHHNQSDLEVTNRRCAQPYLSLVVTNRNDSHGGNTHARFQTFLDHLAEMCDRHGLECELVVVEWNPPEDKPRLAEAMRWKKSTHLDVCIVVVPSAVHYSLNNADKFPLFQMIAKNVGVRRARGEFILATNIDVLFSDALTALLAQKGLDPECFYRIDRYDIASTSLPEGLSPEARLSLCEQDVIRVNSQFGTYAVGSVPPQGDPKKLHSPACGDFTLMHREKWFALKGYPEFELWSIYIDGLLIHSAAAVGMQQVILRDPCRIYHIEHELAWSKTQEAAKTRPSLHYQEQYTPMCRKMLMMGKPLDVNPDHWGFADMDFEEQRPADAYREGRQGGAASSAGEAVPGA